MSVTVEIFKKVMGNFASGVTVVTIPNAGVTISSFASLSLEPQLVLFSLGKKSRYIERFAEEKYLSFSLLSEKQKELSDHFASYKNDDFSMVDFTESSLTGNPLLEGAMAHIECEKYKMYDGGDHNIFICKVLAVNINNEHKPLIHFRSAYYTNSEIK